MIVTSKKSSNLSKRLTNDEKKINQKKSPKKWLQKEFIIV